jgi:hypothetical protein
MDDLDPEERSSGWKLEDFGKRWSPVDWLIVVTSYVALFLAYGWPMARIIMLAHGWHYDWVSETTSYWFGVALYGTAPAAAFIFVYTFLPGWNKSVFGWRLLMLLIFGLMVVPPMWLSIVAPNILIGEFVVTVFQCPTTTVASGSPSVTASLL